MKNISEVIYFLFLISFVGAPSIEDLRHFFYKTISSSAIYDITNAERSLSKRSLPMNLCDENKLMLTLANLEIISPERLLLLLTTFESSIQVCSEVTTTIRTIDRDQKNCRPLDDDNLYMMLFKGLKMFELVFCKDEKYMKDFDIIAECLHELREEYIDCEGPADWFEFPNKTIVCGTFIDIVSCDYIKTAELCGRDTGVFLYCILTKFIGASLKQPCDIPKKVPQIKSFADELSAAPSATGSNPFFILATIITGIF